MAHVMVSYKREDEPRVAVLVRALRANGLEIWWDQALPGGEAWRENIQGAIDQAGCVVVVWSHGSTGPDGGFVRDEATRAKARSILVPVAFDNVMPPLGFGELQAIDLKHWKGGAKDPRSGPQAADPGLGGRARRTAPRCFANARRLSALILSIARRVSARRAAAAS